MMQKICRVRPTFASPVGPSRSYRSTTRTCRVQAAAAGDGKSVLITGANVGIGYVTAKKLAAQGYATVLACRDPQKGAAARDQIKLEVPGAKVETVYLDLAKLSTVRDLANRCLDGNRPLDVLINNAGVMAPPRMETSDGFELQLGVNHLGHYLLTTMLLPLLTDPSRPSRVVNLSSSAHKFGTINFNDLMQQQNYERWSAYGQSKLANVLFTYELARRLPVSANLTVNALHPGVVYSELGRYLLPAGGSSWWQQPLLAVSKAFLKTPEQGAQTSIFLASSPQVQGVSSKYFVDCKPQTSSKESYDANVARKLWEVSTELTHAPEQLQLAANDAVAVV